MPLVEPMQLREHFELVAGIYRRHDQGLLLAEWFKADWAMFPNFDHSNTSTLLADILDDGEIVRYPFAAPSPQSDHVTRWTEFRSELMHTNRFFPQTVVDLDRLQALFSFLILKPEELSSEWYRCRIQETPDSPYTANQMGAPPKESVSHGRANPVGIPYLYIASDPETAISETRPHAGETASVAKVKITSDLKLVDLRSPKITVSPFEVADDQEIAGLRKDIGFLEHLGDELTRPVRPRAAAIDYLPTQYLCEFVKKSDFHGVMYRSAVSNGVNVALFEPNLGQVLDEIETYEVKRVHVDSVRTAP